MLQLNPPIPMTTPKGKGYANFLIDRGMDYDNEWIVFLNNGEIWSFLNNKVRVEENQTYERKCAPKHSEESAGPGKLISPEVSSSAGSLGTRAIEHEEAKFGQRSVITNDAWIQKLRSPEGACC